MRVPARIGVLFGLSVAALAGAGFQALLNWAARSGWRIWARVALAAALIGVIGVESLNRPYPLTPVATGAAIPPVDPWLATQPAGVTIELPFVRSHYRAAEQRTIATNTSRYTTLSGW